MPSKLNTIRNLKNDFLDENAKAGSKGAEDTPHQPTLTFRIAPNFNPSMPPTAANNSPNVVTFAPEFNNSNMTSLAADTMRSSELMEHSKNDPINLMRSEFITHCEPKPKFLIN